MKPMNELTAKTILSDEVLTEVFEQEDEIYKARLLLSLADRAAELGVKVKFDAMVRAYKRAEREMRKRDRDRSVASLENWTNFIGPYDNMFCGSWIAREDGIFAQNMGTVEQIACYHPILPVERLKNLETGEEQIKLAYKRNGRWEEIVVPKTLITSANKIVALSGRGVAVTSENARLLVRFLSDVENLNSNDIAVQYSSSKLGWVKGDFLPYDTEIIFDGDSRFRQAFDSIGERGNREKWFDHVLQLRRTGRIEIKMMLAASFASVLIHLVGGLPFFVDLWGETEGGKTVTLMLAASVWANPDESAYIGDFKTTDVALEAKADMLNHLPVMLDDTSKTSARIRENFEGVVYDLCSGKGKSRSNKELGINRENRWRNAILTNGERPLASYVSQGGAINRILEVECGERVYPDPQATADILKNNYGFAGKEFIQVLKDMGTEEIRKIQQDFQAQIMDDEKMQKQSISLSIILAADKIATEHLFKDREYIPLNEAKKVLIDRNELSDNERCYRYILDKISMNSTRFDTITSCEKWGVKEKGYAIFYNQAFDELCKSGGFSKKSFLSWAGRNDLIVMQGGQPTKVKKIDGSPQRCVWLKLEDFAGNSDQPNEDGDGFVLIESGQERLPFD